MSGKGRAAFTLTLCLVFFGSGMAALVLQALWLQAAGLFLGHGVWASSLTRSQITAFIVGAGLMFLLILVGLDPLLVGLPPGLGTVAARVGVLSHFESLGRDHTPLG